MILMLLKLGLLPFSYPVIHQDVENDTKAFVAT